MWGRSGLIGATGFVGGALARQIAFARAYDSKTIRQIEDEEFDVLICAGAPAEMWLANCDPVGDRRNLEQLVESVNSCKARYTILVSTIAVLDDPAAGYDESNARFEETIAYGKNRRMLEEHVASRAGAVVIRLPALFGAGLKKNFIFDLMNPVPSFLKPEVYRRLIEKFDSTERDAASAVFTRDDSREMMRLDRRQLESSSNLHELLIRALRREGFLSRRFTNSESKFQFYDVSRLASDIETCLSRGIRVLHAGTEPLRAGELHRALLGSSFENSDPPVIAQDMRTSHAAAFGGAGDYLCSADQVLAGLRNFMSDRTT